MEAVKRFEDLWIWQQARILVKEIYTDFSQNAVGSRDFGFKDQIQRAGISTMNNIAEGFERHTDAEFARFLDMAKGVCGEVRSMYYSAEDLTYVDHQTAETRRSRTKQIAAGISSLIGHLREESEGRRGKTSKSQNVEESKRSNVRKVEEPECRRGAKAVKVEQCL